MFPFDVIHQQSAVTVVGVTFRTHERSVRGMHSDVILALGAFRKGHRTVRALEPFLRIVRVHMPIETMAGKK